MIRAHFYRPIVDNSGRLADYAEVRVFEEDGVSLITQTIWRDPDTSVALENGFSCTPAVIEFYLDIPQRVALSIRTPGNGPVVLWDVDVYPDARNVIQTASPIILNGVPPENTFRTIRPLREGGFGWWHLVPEHDHLAPSTNSTYLGQGPHVPLNSSGAVVLGDQAGPRTSEDESDSVMVGYEAQVFGQHAVAVGAQSIAHDRAVALGEGAEALDDGLAVGMDAFAGLYAVALGYLAVAEGQGGVSVQSKINYGRQSIAIGVGSSVDINHSTAIGRNAQVSTERLHNLGQHVVLGGAAAPYDVALPVIGFEPEPAVYRPTTSLVGAPTRETFRTAYSGEIPVSVITWHPDYELELATSALVEQPVTGLVGGPVREVFSTASGGGARIYAIGDAVLGGPDGLGFFGKTLVAQQPTITGSEQVNEALGYLLDALGDLGLLVRSTSDQYVPPPLPGSGAVVNEPIHPVVSA